MAKSNVQIQRNTGDTLREWGYETVQDCHGTRVSFATGFQVLRPQREGDRFLVQVLSCTAHLDSNGAEHTTFDSLGLSKEALLRMVEAIDSAAVEESGG